MKRELKIVEISTALHVVFAILFTCQITIGQDAEQRLPFILETVEVTQTSSYQRILIDDLDNDGFAEMVDLIGNPGKSKYFHMHYHDGDLNSVSWQKNYIADDAYALHAMDIVGDRDKELFVSIRQGGEIVVSIYNLKGDIVSSFKRGHGEDLNGDDIIDIGITLHAVVDLNGDGNKEAIFAHTAGHDLNPRGVLAYDIYADEPLWYYPTAGPPRYVKLFYPDDTSLPFLAVITSSPSNGNVVNGMNDSHTYLLILSSEGKLLHTETLGEHFTQGSLHIVDYDNDGQTELITSLGSASTDPKIRTNITAWQFDPEKEQLYLELRREFILPLREGILVDDINRDGKMDFIIRQRGWSLSILDSRFDIIATWRSINQLSPYLTADLNGDGRKEIYVRSQIDKKTLVFDEKLNLIAEFPDEGELFLYPIGQGKKPLLALKGASILYLLSLKRTALSSNLPPTVFWWGILIGSVTVLFFATVFGFRYRKKHSYRSFISNEGVAVLFGVVQTLIHDLKTRLSSMRLELRNYQHEVENEVLDKQKLLLHSEHFEDDIADMLQSSTKALKITKLSAPNLQLSNLNSILRKVVKRYRRTLPDKLNLNENYDSELMKFAMDDEQIRMAIENIISNAFYAVGDTGTIDIRTSLTEEVIEKGEISQVAEVEISDSGSGIQSTKTPRLKESIMSFSSNSSGLGLLITQKIIADHGGTFRLSSEIGKGTIVTFRLPIMRAE